MGNRPHTRLIALAVFTAAALCATPLAAQETVDDEGSTAVEFALDPAWEHFRVSIGAFLMRFNSLIRLDSEEHGIGTDIVLAVDWFPWKHVGLGAGFNSVHLNYDSDKKGELKVDYDYNGVLVYVTLVY